MVYLDETWINIHHTYFKEWMKDDVARVVPTRRGERLILLHAIDKNQGFLPGCQLLFKSISTDGRDYHTEMNGVIFEDWLKNKLLPVLPEPSLIIMDNAPYHKRQDEDTKAPTMANKHSEIQKWLNDRNIPFAKSGPDSHKKALVNLVKAHKPPQQFTSEQLIRKAGHDVLYLPPYHCQFNPIEPVWGIVKNDVAFNNTEFKLEPMRQLTEEAIARVPLTVIQITFKHVEKVENEYFEKDGLHIAPVFQPMIIDTQDSADEYTSYSESDDE